MMDGGITVPLSLMTGKRSPDRQVTQGSGHLPGRGSGDARTRRGGSGPGRNPRDVLA